MIWKPNKTHQLLLCIHFKKRDVSYRYTLNALHCPGTVTKMLSNCRHIIYFSSPRLVTEITDDKIIPDVVVGTSLQTLLESFKWDEKSIDQLHSENSKCMLKNLGFQIGRLPSSLPSGGTGVFVTEGQVKQGTIVAMYPGRDNSTYLCHAYSCKNFRTTIVRNCHHQYFE